MKIYMFRTVRLSIIRSLFTVHSAMVYVIQVCRQLSSSTRMVLLETDELSETCRFLWQNKFVKLVYLVGFITKKDEINLLQESMVCEVWNIESISRFQLNSWHAFIIDQFTSHCISLLRTSTKKNMLKVNKYFPYQTTCEFATSSSLLLMCYTYAYACVAVH
jgi:hypothetical protein